MAYRARRAVAKHVNAETTCRGELCHLRSMSKRGRYTMGKVPCACARRKATALRAWSTIDKRAAAALSADRLQTNTRVPA